MNNFIENKFTFIPGLDVIGHDIECYGKIPITNLMNIAMNKPGCVGFNTLGFLKNNIVNLQPSPYFGEGDGIYILNENINKPQPTNLIKEPESRVVQMHTVEDIVLNDPFVLNPIFIETGSYIGDGIQAAIDSGFKEIHSIELSEKYYNICKERFKNNKNVTIHFGDSGVVLEDLIRNIDNGITFWLDGHYSSSDTACARDYCSPIQQELSCIRRHIRPDHVIMIDDMKDFTKKSIEWNLQNNGKCGYIEKNKLEEILEGMHPQIKTYDFGPACVSYSSTKTLFKS